jgi:hypothetical protein
MFDHLSAIVQLLHTRASLWYGVYYQTLRQFQESYDWSVRVPNSWQFVEVAQNYATLFAVHFADFNFVIISHRFLYILNGNLTTAHRNQIT